MKKYTTVLFDLDGTLVDSGIGVTNSVEYALNKFGIEAGKREELFRFIGPPLAVSFSEFCGFDEEKTRIAIQYYREYYKQKGINECEMYEGVPTLLKELKKRGYKIGLATSKPDIFAHVVIANKQIENYFDFIGAASADEKTRATKEAVIEYALELSEEKDADKIIMVGDRHFDIKGAKAFGLDSIGVLFGYGSKEELTEAGADYLAKSPLDILNILK